MPDVSLHWLRDYAWPLWLERGVDWDRGAFHEHLDLDTLQCGADFRRLRVAARQVYVFSKAVAYGVPGAEDAVALGLRFLRGPAHLGDGGFAWRFDLNNKPIDLRRDLYDHAFVLLAFSAAAAVEGPASVRKDAVTLLNYITQNFQHPSGGYEESIPPTRPRRQNPHMHLLEALLAAHQAFGDPIFFERAQELIDTFVDRLFQPQPGAIPEYFDEDLVPIRELGRYAVEPGHHYEWIWLLDWYTKTAGMIKAPRRLELNSVADALLKFADFHGLDRVKGSVVNSIWCDGAIDSSGFRLWPQTERLKVEARLARGPNCFRQAASALSQFMEGVRPGLWNERMYPQGSSTREPAPATSLYHITSALTDAFVLAHTKQ